ncbi:MAG: SpvB/TcaC N-terminal domain-containing protein [Haliscomenobacter sp.]|uniref:SpvB/TcaC N-terminal domain-containing protein n=1 Tax=Haliscomenobacter sp. TaxID=2717303 RepID=UPI0029B6B3C8|nr:SpvB/TcaC N-terminal domain-containing protein [Haliscomenobacter sp.]MDX2070966.1 SpvB/TcaC N-terminal domain-containing protein [Haliscomenobacter sp.]
MKKKLPFLLILIIPIYITQQQNLKTWVAEPSALIKSFLKASNPKSKENPSISQHENPFGQNKAKTVEVYSADLKGGSIGQSPNFPVDDPFDNVFHIHIPHGVKPSDRVFLQYELKGVQDHSAVSRSINEAQAVGGYLIQEGKSWQLQNEEINPIILKNGDNVIRFGLPEGAKFRYSVREIKLLIKKANAFQARERRIVVNQPFKVAYDHRVLLKGFIGGIAADSAKIFVDEQAQAQINGEYECLLTNPDTLSDKWTVQLKAVFPDRQVLVREINIEEQQKARYRYPLEAKGLQKTARFTQKAASQLQFEGLQLEVPANALTQDQTLSVTALRDVDIPALGSDLVNVTANHRGYRLLPDGTQFKKQASLRVPYDSTLIPEGYTAADIKTFFFDEDDRRWKALPKDTLLKSQNTLQSSTNHFTDYINGIIKVPESPQTQGYKPTEIKGLEAGNPSNNITFIAPPGQNNMGTANLQFPLKLPAGRQGMQPQLAIQYNSEGGNGWLGLGWDLSIPSVNIETRWGVPQFDPNLETETYLMGGQMLTPLAHRAEPIARIRTDRRFYPRIEGSFQKIIRHGTNPENYWWEVTSTDGTKNFYGGTPGAGVDGNAVLKDNDGNIVHWCLRETRDLNGNFVRYHYITVQDAGVKNSTNLGRQIYIDEISYTGFEQDEGEYKIQFIRDRQIKDPKRLDVQINGRLGFKQVTADLLREVNISFDQKLVRSYELIYGPSAFYTSQLHLIIEKDQEKKEFYRHGFEYFNELKNGDDYDAYGEEVKWATVDDRVNAGLGNELGKFKDEITPLGGSKSSNFSFGLAINLGLPLACGTKELSAGVNFGYSESESEGISAFLDINGDNLPDKIFKDDQGLWYRPNLYSDGKSTKFGDKKRIRNVSEFSKSETRTTSVGFELVFYAFVGSSTSSSRTNTDTYFSDFNGDGLIDIAHNGTVWFNHVASNGEIIYTTDSNDTPNPIKSGASINPNVLFIDPDYQNKLIDENPLHDVVKMWKPPYPGVVNVSGKITLNTTKSRLAYGKFDGVKASIEFRGQSYDLNDARSFTVDTSDHIYFRLQSKIDGAFDQVHWDPIIQYAKIDLPNDGVEEKDANGKKVHFYQASKDFLLAAPQSATLPYKGTIKIEATLKKPITSDSIRVEIAKVDTNANMAIVYSRNFNWDKKIDTLLSIDNLKIDVQDEVKFYIKSNTNIAWDSLIYQPRVWYTGKALDVFTNREIETEDKNGKPLQILCPTADFPMYNYVIKKTQVFTPNKEGTIVVKPKNTKLLGPQEPVNPKLKGAVTISLKGINKLYFSRTFRVLDDKIIDTVNFSKLKAKIPAGEPVFVELFFPSRGFVDSLGKDFISADVTFEGAPIQISPGKFSKLRLTESVFGNLYRGWGQFAYNGNRNRASQEIDRKELQVDPNLQKQPSRGEFEKMRQDPQNVKSPYEPTKDIFIMMAADAKNQRWLGYDPYTWVKKDTISSSRFGDDDIILKSAPVAGSGRLSAPRKFSKSESFSIAGGGSSPFGGASTSYSETKSTDEIMVMDFDGDRYADIAGPDYIQATDMLGRREPNLIRHGISNHSSTATSVGVSANGSYASAKNSNTSNAGMGGANIAVRVQASAGASTCKAKESTESAKKSIALPFSGSLGYNTSSDHVEHSWMDINADGLPDKLYANGEVQFNFGKKFGPKEKWGEHVIREGESTDFSSGLGYNWASMSFSGGISVSQSENQTTKLLQDLNGDGLLDSVKVESPIKVRFNLGAGFGPEVIWKGTPDSVLEKGISVGTSFNGSFTLCIHIIAIVPIFKICINPNGSYGFGSSTEVHQIVDINGDGYPDLVKAGENGQLLVRLSKIGRTNLLKTVTNPLNGSFTLDYDLTPNTYDMPNSKWVLSSVETNDGVQGDGADRSKITFTYSGGKYSRRERDFYGFNQVIAKELDTEKKDAVYRVHTYKYLNENYYEKGLMVQETMSDAGGKKYTETINHFALLDLAQNVFSKPETEEIAPAFPALKKTENKFYEGQATAGFTKTTTFEYDRYGNVIEFTDFGDNSPGDLLVAKIEYANFPNNGLFSIPNSIEIRDFNNVVVRARKAEVQANGDITKIEQLISISGNTWAEYKMQYDAYGNLTQLTRPKNYKNQTMTYDYTYDPEVHTYVVKVKDAYGYESSSEYDYRFGMLVKSQDINHQVITYTLDPQGRIATITSPYEMGNWPYTIKYEYFPNAPVSYAKTTHYDQDNPKIGILTYTFMDGLQRPIQVKKSGVIFKNENSEQETLIVSGKTIYDAFGRTLLTHYPIEDTGTAIAYNPKKSNYSVSKTFDVLDREVNVTLPDGAATTMEYSIISGPCNCFKTLITDALGTQKEEWKDIRERTRTTIDYGPPTLTTTYQYNAISDLLRVVDVDGNELEYTYDQLGRKLSMEHPDAGKTEFEYDDVGNLLKKTTPNIREVFAKKAPNTAIQYTYDYERLVQIDYPQNYQNKVVYHYGGPEDTRFNQAGRIRLQEDATGGQEFFYGPLGEVVKNIRTVLVNESTELTFVWENEYDSWNRIQKMKYPDLEEVSYEYNTAGKLKQIKSLKANVPYTIVENMGYDEFEQRVFLHYGNGTKNFYKYEPKRRRLQELISTDRTGIEFMHKQYSYDPVDNITTVENLATGSLVNLGGATKHNYTYDKLYRLTAAKGTYSKLEQKYDYSLQMEYDELHNILSKSQTLGYNGKAQAAKTYNLDYLYKDGKPHQAIQIGKKSYTYDANGNQTGWTMANEPKRRDVYWDEENRITHMNENGYLHYFTYDAAGERVIKSEGGIQALFLDGNLTGPIAHEDNYTAYISPYLVYKADKFTKHYYIESQRILSKIGTGDFYANRLPTGQGITAGNKDYSKRKTELQEALKKFLDSQGFEVNEPSLTKRQQDLIKAGIPIPNLNTDNYTRAPRNWPQPQPGKEDTTCLPPFLLIPLDSLTNEGVTAGYGFVTAPFTQETNHFFYHPDHLGSTNFITDIGGIPRQFAEYIPYGETFVEEHTSTDTQPYLFNAKEYDDGTGLYYYGARYYDPVASIWVSVDPMLEKYPGWSPYNYTMLNPVKYVDPDGKFPLPTVALGALIGGAIGAGVSFAMTDGSIEDKFAAGAKGLLSGALTGAIAGTGAGLLWGVAGSAAGSALVQGSEIIAGDRKLESFSGKEVAISALASVVVGAGGNLLKKGLENTIKHETGRAAVKALREQVKKSLALKGGLSRNGIDQVSKAATKNIMNFRKELFNVTKKGADLIIDTGQEVFGQKIEKELKSIKNQ